MATQIYSYGNTEALHGIFNAVAMIFGADDYKDMVRTAIVLGFLIVAVYAMHPRLHWKGLSWFGSVLLVYSIFFVPKETVIITDKLGTSPPVTVANVPWSLALFAGVKSQIGQTLTNMFETAFQTIPGSTALPAELSYQSNGLMFGSRLVKVSRGANLQDPQLHSDLVNYMRNCVVPELGKSIDPQAFQQSSTLWGISASPNAALFTNYMKGGSYVVNPCPTAYADLTAKLPGAIADVRKQAAATLFPQETPGNADAKLSGALMSAYAKMGIAGASSSVADILLQNTMLNLWADTQQFISVGTADPAAVMLAATKANATAQMNMSYTSQGRIAEEALPIVRNVTEGILYAAFPIIALLLVASEGQALGRVAKSYIYALIWVELWPPMFAVLNFIATTYSAKNVVAAAYTGAGTGLSLENAAQIYSTTVSDVAVVGYMVIMVPTLAGALLWGMDKIVSAVPGGASIGGSADRAAQQTSQGNLQYGNMSMQQHVLGPNTTDAFMNQHTDARGTLTTSALTGDMRYTYNLGNNPLSISDTKQIAAAASQERGKATEVTEQQQKLYANEVSATANEVIGLAKANGRGNTRINGVALNDMNSDGTTSNDLREIANDVSRKFGITDRDGVEKVISGKLGISSPFAGAQFEGRTASAEEVSAALNSGRQALAKRGLARQQQVLESFQTSDDFKSLRSSSREATERIDAGLTRAKRFSETAAASKAQSDRYAEVMRVSEVLSRDITYNPSADWNKWLRDRGVLGTTDRNVLMNEAQSFLLSGQVLNKDGIERFYPLNGGSPNIMQGVSDHVGGTSPESLTGRYDLLQPGGGRDAILKESEGQKGIVVKAQKGQGLDPSSSVGDGGLRARAATARAAAVKAGEAARTAYGADAYNLKDEYAQRLSKVEIPIGGRELMGSKATPAARHPDGVVQDRASDFPGAKER